MWFKKSFSKLSSHCITHQIGDYKIAHHVQSCPYPGHGHPTPAQQTQPTRPQTQPTHPQTQPTRPQTQPPRPQTQPATHEPVAHPSRPTNQPITNYPIYPTQTQAPVQTRPTKPAPGYPYPSGTSPPTNANGQPVYPTRPTQSESQQGGQTSDPTKPGSPGTAIGVYPPQSTSKPGTDPNIGMSNWPFYVLPYPFPLGGGANAPGNCPCNSGSSQNSNSGQQQQSQQPSVPSQQTSSSSSSGSSSNSQSSQQQSASQNSSQLQTGWGQQLSQPPYGIIGFIPVVFFPCLNQSQTAQIMQQMNPIALSYPGPCTQCQQQPKQQQPQQQQQQVQQPSGQRVGLFHDSESASVKQILKRRVRGRKAKIDSSIDLDTSADELEPKVE